MASFSKILVVSGIAVLLLAATVSTHPFDTSKISSNPDEPLGTWISKAQDSQTEIFKSGDKYHGKLLAGWGNELYEKDGKTLRKDAKNPNPALRNQPLLNAIILSDLEYDNGEYKHGNYYDARTGRTFNCTMNMKDDKLEIRIYWKVPIFGLTKTWTRVRS